MPIANQGLCHSRKTAKNCSRKPRLAEFPNQVLAPIPKPRPGTSPLPARRLPDLGEECVNMIGKLFGAWLGEKVVGKNQGAKGAILGYGAASLARRSVPTLAALAIGGWAWRRWRGKRRADAAYPSEATPSSPSES
jgi:hypothetical protein